VDISQKWVRIDLVQKSLYLERENEKTKNKLRRRDADVSGACHYEATCDTVHTHRPKLRKKKAFSAQPHILPV
jgi:hypothetical protein